MKLFKKWFTRRSYKNHQQNDPPKPKEVYKNGILYYTTSYVWVDPNSKMAQIFKSGWVELKHMNYDHPLMDKEMEAFEKAREKIRKSAEVDWAKMRDIYFDI